MYTHVCIYISLSLHITIDSMLTMVAASLAIAMSSQYSIGGIYSK